MVVTRVRSHGCKTDISLSVLIVYKYKCILQPLELVGHSQILRALALGNLSVPKQLVSAAEDYIIIWNLQQARKQFEKGKYIVLFKP